MDPNYDILDIDIYADLRKQEQIELARKYNLNIPEDPNSARSRDLRQLLSITKTAHRLAKNSNDAEIILKKVLNKIPLNQTEIDNYPDIQRFGELLQSIYDTAEFNELQPTYENIHLPSTPPLDLLPYPLQSPRSEHIYTELEFNNHPQLSPTHPPSSERLPQATANTSSPSTKPPSTDNRRQQTTVNCQSENQTSTISNQNINMTQENKPLVKATTYSGLDSENCQEFLDKFELAAKINSW